MRKCACRIFEPFALPLLFEHAFLDEEPPPEPSQRGQGNPYENGEPDGKPERRSMARGGGHRGLVAGRAHYIHELGSGHHHMCVTPLSGVECQYAFMRATVDLPPTLLSAAQARAADRGEALKTLFTRAVTRELDRFAHAVRDGQAVWPLITSGRKGTVRLTNDDLARIDAGEDEARAGRATRRR